MPAKPLVDPRRSYNVCARNKSPSVVSERGVNLQESGGASFQWNKKAKDAVYLMGKAYAGAVYHDGRLLERITRLSCEIATAFFVTGPLQGLPNAASNLSLTL